MSAITEPKATETPLDRAVREAVDAAPPLTAETRDELSQLLSKGDA